jgi:release factor glutamine methyltransferase
VTTIDARVSAARHRLRDAGIAHDEAALDARLLAQHLLGWDAARTLASGRDEEPAWFPERYEAAVRRREHREPVAYITGTKEFWNLALEVSSDVLIPRPETEAIVEAVLDRFPERGATLTVADVCTGSGCIAVAIASERPRARVLGTDISRPALAVARRNAVRHSVADRLGFVCSDLLSGVEAEFDVIVSNPPYVPAPSRAALQPEVREFEPAMALFGGLRGLDVVERLLRQSVEHLARNGWLIVEFGDGQEASVRELISGTDGLTMIDARPDLQGIARVAVARRHAT